MNMNEMNDEEQQQGQKEDFSKEPEKQGLEKGIESNEKEVVVERKDDQESVQDTLSAQQSATDAFAGGQQGVDGFGTPERAVPSHVTEIQRPPSFSSKYICHHPRWSKVDRTRFKDRIVWLEVCRRCRIPRSTVFYRDMNSRRVYVGRDVFYIPNVKSDIEK